MVTCKDIKEFCIAFWHNGVAKFGGSVGLFLTLFSLYVERYSQR